MIETPLGMVELLLFLFYAGALVTVNLTLQLHRLMILWAFLPLLLMISLPFLNSPPASRALMIGLPDGKVEMSRETISNGDLFISKNRGKTELVRPSGPETGRGMWTVVINDSDRLLTVKVYYYRVFESDKYVPPEVVGFVRPGEIWWTWRSINYNGGGPPSSHKQLDLLGSFRVFNLEVSQQAYDAAGANMSEKEIEDLRARIRAEELKEIAEQMAKSAKDRP